MSALDALVLAGFLFNDFDVRKIRSEVKCFYWFKFTYLTRLIVFILV